jgi:alkanesulfonate monooxygenase
MTERIARMQRKAADAGRELRFGVRFHVLSRDTHEEAVAAAEKQLEGVTPEQVARAQAVLNATDSAGESRQRAFVGSEDLWVEPNLWAGIGQVRRGIGVTVLGSHEEVARKFLSFVDMGLSFFILSGYPHLEEAENAGKTWMPLFYEMLRRRSASLAAG